MEITKGLIIADPWIGYILDGSKTWEMRSSGTNHRGWFALIRKGTGAIQGIARLAEVGSPLAPAEMLSTFKRHRIPAALIESGEVSRWNTPWVLADVRRLTTPVRYRHKSGAVTWVALDGDVASAITDQIGNVDGAAETPTIKSTHRAFPTTSERRGMTQTQPAPVNSEIRIKINEANLRNSHFYLREHVHKFPDEAIGGSNKAKAAKREIVLDWGGPDPARTDIDGEDKKFFRARGWVGAFYKLNDAQPGDWVAIEPTAPYRYRVRLEKAS